MGEISNDVPCSSGPSNKQRLDPTKEHSGESTNCQNTALSLFSVHQSCPSPVGLQPAGDVLRLRSLVFCFASLLSTKSASPRPIGKPSLSAAFPSQMLSKCHHLGAYKPSVSSLVCRLSVPCA